MSRDGEKWSSDAGDGSVGERGPVGARSRVVRRYGGARAPAAAPTVHDVATTAVEGKGAGRQIDATVSARVGAHLGSDFSAVRVHDDALSQQASEAMGARAFAYGADVFLGPGEHDGDLGLMAHELTHVAQQGAAGQRMPQRQVQVGDAASPAEHQADQVAAAVTGGAAPSQLLVDEPPVGPGQMLKSQFFDQLRAAATAAAEPELGPVYAGLGCPYIEQYFSRYAAQPAAAGEAMIRRAAPGARGARSAAELIPTVVARVLEGVRTWRDTGQPPPDLAAATPDAAATAAAAPATAQALRAPGGEDTLASLEAELGPGAPLDGGTAQRMSDALGTDVSHARIHAGPVAARKAAEVGAAAFTVGSNVVMGASAPAAGSLPGDALLAHELAHAAQQRDAAQDPVARRRPIGGEDAVAEDHADAAAAGAVAGIHGQGRFALLAQRLGSAFRTGLQLQRCPQQAQAPQPTVVSNQIVDGPYAWQSKFDVTLSGNECRVVIKPKLVPDAGVTPQQVTDVKQRARTAFANLFDNKFILTDTANNQQFNLRAEVQFVDSGEHYTVALHDGPDGNGNLTNWYTGNYDETLAHELGHQLGLKDEYIDATAPNRAAAGSPGVFTDHSIMGNYLAEGRPQAGVQLRHGQTIGNEIGGATGHTFTVARRP